MRWRSSRRVSRQWLRAGTLLIVFVLLLDLVFLLHNHRIFERNLRARSIGSPSQLPALVRHDKIFICAQFWTNVMVLATYWNENLISLVNTLGPENVYVSILESGSLDNSKEFLKLLDTRLEALGVQRTIILDKSTHQDEISGVYEMPDGWIHNPTNSTQREVRRIPYLARLRNKALQPLRERSTGMTFDKVLFLNDVVFSSSDVLTLLGSRDGRYSVACALDFNEWSPSLYYDTFVLKDDKGGSTISRSFPYFRSHNSRQSLLRGEPVKVQSCWNGMIVMDASPFYGQPGSQEAIAFRAIPDSLAEMHLEGSECCLIHVDLARRGLVESGIWLNPAVRVGYKPLAYEGVHLGDGYSFVLLKDYISGVWTNRLMRWTTSGSTLARKIARRIRAWKSEGKAIGEERDEPGEVCLIDEMHVLIWNGWKHL